MKHEHATLTALGKELPVLQSVTACGRLEGLLLSMTLRQTYRNESSDNLEVIYTFPLAWGAVLLGLETTLGGRRLKGQVLERGQAQQRYEEAIEEGHAPIMVEESSPGLFSATLGSLKPGETAELELSYAQLLSFEQGRIRLVVPTTVAPRYGDPVSEGGISASQAAAPSMFSDHGFKLNIELHGAVSEARVGSPTHHIRQQRHGDVVTLTLQNQAWLDRDFVLLLDGLASRSFALMGTDSASGPEHVAVIASFCPVLPERKPAPLRLKVLVDCSGSMAGDSMAQARAALAPLATQLTETDEVSFSRFGSFTEHVLAPAKGDESTRQALIESITDTQANLGGTELEAALQNAFDLRMTPAADSDEADILLVTDGEVWDAQRIVDASRHSGHRIYALGVGSAPAESLLREMAESTGGACEFATPEEDMSKAIQRLMARIRLTLPLKPDLDVGVAPLWCSPLPQRWAVGETAHVYLRLPKGPQQALILHLASAASKSTSTSTCVVRVSNDLIARLVAAREVRMTTDKAHAQALALRYQLVTEHTRLVLVFERSQAERTDGMPALHTVSPMLAAGWGASGQVSQGQAIPLAVPRVYRKMRDRASRFPVDPLIPETFEVPAFLRRRDKVAPDRESVTAMPHDHHPHATPQEILLAFNAGVASTQSFMRALRWVKALPHSSQLQHALVQATDLLASRSLAWACHLLWLHETGRTAKGLSDMALALVRSETATVDPHLRVRCNEIFESVTSQDSDTVSL